jgi:hypothetical protein
MENIRKRLFTIFSMGLFIFIIYLSFLIQENNEESRITGLVVVEQGIPPVLNQVPQQQIVVGEEFSYQLEVNDVDSTHFTFQDNTPLFNVDENGVIEFVPTEENKGEHTAVVIAEDESGNFDSILIIFNIT